MIFEEIVLYNFGIYNGRHVVKLNPPSSQKAIILFGGLNGSGKTTLLDALQVTLYGKFAKCSNRGSMNYFDYLRRMINYHADQKGGASLELQFKHYRSGKEESIRIQRAWHSNNKNIKETVEVRRDGVLDSVLTDRWYEYVEEFIPTRISNLFFFDGEKIEALANTDKSAELLKTGIHALLGLDLVDRLTTDLFTIEQRRHKAQFQSEQSYIRVEELEKLLEQLENKFQDNTEQKIKAQEQLTQAEQEYEKLLEEYRREGGDLFEQRAEIQVQLELAQQKRKNILEQLRELTAGEAPLMLIPDLLREAEQQAIREQEAKLYQALDQELNEHDALILKSLTEYKVKASARTAVENFMAQEQVKRQQAFKTECYINIEPQAFAPLQNNILTQVQSKITEVMAKAEKIFVEMDICEQKLESIPDPESLTGIQTRLENIQTEIKTTQSQIDILEQEHIRLEQQIIRQKEDLTGAYEGEAKEEFARETTKQVIVHIDKVRSTLAKFGLAITQKHIRRLETLILDSFQQLVRKENFINHIDIDTNSYTLTLYTQNHEKLRPEILSAGERQLLAVSILWGLSRAAGRPLPAIIDTPLSRLDGKHRHNLVENYFHQASHQVILLSTDEEINKKYYHDLKPSIGREYHIFYDEEKQSSVINAGYFF
ncbi:ATPase involved in DNA repair [Beggiatoa sp. PS]|nr:ATPase involved in DNA repair [Beggiatoa sp. PS]